MESYVEEKEFYEELQGISKELDGQDTFLGKDLLTFSDKISSSRNILFNNNLEQTLVLEKPEFPRVFTGYENVIGSFSTGYFKSECDWKVVEKISKFPLLPDMNFILILYDKKNKVYDLIERKVGESLTESYCYLYNNDNFDSKKKGDVIKKDEIIRRSVSFDENMNYSYGVNAKVVYLIENNTINDAIVCSESFKKKMTNNFIEDVEINVNNNDLLLNLYGDFENYKCFPDIGEKVKKKIISSRRRIEYDKILYDLQDTLLRSVNYNTDTPFYINGDEGTLIDIDIFSNRSIEDLEKNMYNDQIVKYLKITDTYYQSIVDLLGDIMENSETGGYTCSENLSYVYRRCVDIVNKEVKWKDDKNEFDNLVILFKVLNRSEIHVGSKIANRYGGKGVISKIEKDENMPVTEHGERVELILNVLGVVNRLRSAEFKPF